VPDTTTDQPTQPHTAESLSAWLVDRVAAYINLSADQIDKTVALATYGLDSVSAISLCGDIEEDFNLFVEPTAAWDHPTIEALVAFLLDEFGKQTGTARPELPLPGPRDAGDDRESPMT
jgi:acyl carrier protein